MAREMAHSAKAFALQAWQTEFKSHDLHEKLHAIVHHSCEIEGRDREVSLDLLGHPPCSGALGEATETKRDPVLTRWMGRTNSPKLHSDLHMCSTAQHSPYPQCTTPVILAHSRLMQEDNQVAWLQSEILSWDNSNKEIINTPFLSFLSPDSWEPPNFHLKNKKANIEFSRYFIYVHLDSLMTLYVSDWTANL